MIKGEKFYERCDFTMAYVNPDTLQEVANILDDFDEEILINLFKSQIVQDDSYVKIPVNHYEPLYFAYKKAIELDSVEEDDIADIKSRFQNVCISIIQFIQAKYGFEVDMSWIESQYGDLPTLTFALYRFFIIDILYVILAVLNNYIAKNSDELYTAFSDYANKKDVSSLTNQKTMSPIYATIVSSLFDVTDYSFSLLDNETIFDYINREYTPATFIKDCVDRGIIVGDFTRTLAGIYKNNLELRSKIVIELAYRIKERGFLPEATVDLFINHDENSGTDIASESYTDIDSDVDDR